MPEPKNLKEFHGLQGRLAYIRRLMSNLTGCCHPFSHLMQKGAPFAWDDSCQVAFEKIKKYLLLGKIQALKFIKPKCKEHHCVLGVSSAESCVLSTEIN